MEAVCLDHLPGEAWRKVSRQALAQLRARFGDRVRVEYYDLFAPELDGFPTGIMPPKHELSSHESRNL